MITEDFEDGDLTVLSVPPDVASRLHFSVETMKNLGLVRLKLKDV